MRSTLTGSSSIDSIGWQGRSKHQTFEPASRASPPVDEFSASLIVQATDRWWTPAGARVSRWELSRSASSACVRSATRRAQPHARRASTRVPCAREAPPRRPSATMYSGQMDRVRPCRGARCRGLGRRDRAARPLASVWQMAVLQIRCTRAARWPLFRLNGEA